MSGTLLLVNPRRRGRRRKTTGKKRRRHSVRRHVAHSRRGRRYSVRRHMSNPRHTRRRRRRNVVAPYAMNPVRRHRRRRYHSSPVHRRRRRRNPIMGAGFVGQSVMGAVSGTAGALVTDIAWGLVGPMVPAAISGGAIGVLTKAAATIALGIVATMVKVPRRLAVDATQGALTVQLYNYVRPMLAGKVPGLSGLGYYGAGYALHGGVGMIPSSLRGDDDDLHYNYGDLGKYISGLGMIPSSLRGVDEYISE